jgi:hypothetical protein
MSQHEYEHLLVAANLAQFHNTWGFQIILIQWKNFIEGHWFTTTINYNTGVGTFEVDKKIDLNAFINGKPKIDKKNYHFIRIGVLNSYSPRKVEMQQNMYGIMIVTPPRLNRLRIKQ